jgi:hypothetical protein
MLRQLMTQMGEEILALRSQATRTVGIVAVAVGREHFTHEMVQEFTHLAVQGFQLDFFELRESTHLLFSSLAELLGEEFMPLLTVIMPYVVASLMSEDGMESTGITAFEEVSKRIA